MPSGQDADTKSQTCLDQVRRPVAQPPVQASQEASLEIQRAQAAGRPCYEAERTPLAVENSVGKPAANLAPNVGSGKESVAHSHPPFGPCLAGRLGRDYLFSGGAALRIGIANRARPLGKRCRRNSHFSIPQSPQSTFSFSDTANSRLVATFGPSWLSIKNKIMKKIKNKNGRVSRCSRS